MANFDDILFANRNRAYGAYALRQGYRPTLGRAVVLGTLLFVGALQLPALYGWVKPEGKEIMIEATLEDFVMDAPPADPIVVPPKEETVPTVATTKNPVPEVVADAPDEEPIVATVAELENATSGQTTQEGTGEAELVLAPEAATGPTAVEKAVEAPPKPEETFLVVEQMPEFPGGLTALRDYLQRTMRYPAAASNAGISGKVYVGFIVNAEGRLENVTVEKSLGFGTDEEALRVVQAMPRWKPGRQSGRSVRVKYRLPISFALE